MSRPDYREETLEELLGIYLAAAALHGASAIEGEYRVTNRQARILIDVYCELRFRGLEAQRALLEFLDHADRGVRGWAAYHALEFAPEKGLPVLEELAMETGVLALDARMVLQEWRKGRLKIP